MWLMVVLLLLVIGPDPVNTSGDAGLNTEIGDSIFLPAPPRRIAVFSRPEPIQSARIPR